VRRLCLALALASLLPACTPTLNWREVVLDRISVLLPCKPDRAQRSVSWGDKEVALQMAGCEAGSTLYAVSHIRVSDEKAQVEAIEQWQSMALNKLKAEQPKKLVLNAPKGANGYVHLSATGQSSSGAPLVAQLIWFSVGIDVYHVAVYAPTLSADTTEPLISSIKLL
jgi:hypothetical protein